MKIGIIGAGASGLMAAVCASRLGALVTIFEKNDKPGKKLLSTGNGRCNYTNLLMNSDCYNASSRAFVEEALSIFDENDAVGFFKDIGMLSKNKNGYMYPLSEQANTVLDVLAMECRYNNVNIKKNIKIDNISQKGSGFIVKYDDKKDYFDKIIIACGGMAAPKTGSDGGGYEFARQFGHTIVKPVPALVQLRCSDKFFKDLSGVRCESRVSFYINDRCVGSEQGEVQFTDYGLSGIPVFQYSGRLARALKSGEKCKAVIDFMPESTKDEVVLMLNKRHKASQDKTAMELMIGLFNWNINKVLLKRAGISADKKASSLNSRDISGIADYIKEFDAQITADNGFDRAQVTSGGVDISEVNASTMESTLCRGVYFAGEILDVDGRCGGYNLQWAWTSGYIAGRAAAND